MAYAVDGEKDKGAGCCATSVHAVGGTSLPRLPESTKRRDVDSLLDHITVL
jgi:hypothetical protein